MTSDKVVPFPGKNQKKRPLNIKEVETIGLLTTDDRDLWISDKAAIARIFAFIVREKITIIEGDKPE